MPFDPALTISYGFVRSVCLTGTAPNSNPLAMVTSSATAIDGGVRRHRHVDRKSRERLPRAEAAQDDDAAGDTCGAADQRNQHGFGQELPHDPRAARAEREAQRHFAGSIGGARGEQTSEIGARRQQNESSEQRQSDEKSLHHRAKIVAIQTRPRQRERHLPVVLGIRLLEKGADRVQVGNGLRRRHARFQVSDHLEQPVRAPRVQPARARDLFFVDDRHERLGTEEHHRPVEVRRCDPKNRIRMFVEPDHASHHSGIVLKVGVPVRVAEHQVRRAVRTVLVGGVKEAAQIRLNVQRVEVVSGDEIEPHARRIVAGVEARDA